MNRCSTDIQISSVNTPITNFDVGNNNIMYVYLFFKSFFGRTIYFKRCTYIVLLTRIEKGVKVNFSVNSPIVLSVILKFLNNFFSISSSLYDCTKVKHR